MALKKNDAIVRLEDIILQFDEFFSSLDNWLIKYIKRMHIDSTYGM